MAQYEIGDYMVEVLAQRFVESKKKGTLGFEIDFKIEGQINPDTPLDEANLWDCPRYERRAQMWFTDNTVERNIHILRKMGFDGNAFSDLNPDKEGHFSFVGSRQRMSCNHQEGIDDNAGKTFERWEFPMMGGLKAPEAAPKAASKLDALFGKMLKTSAPAKPATRPAAPAKAPLKELAIPANANAEDDGSIPF